MPELKSTINKLQSYAEDINIEFYDLFLNIGKPELFEASKSKVDSLVRLLYHDWLEFRAGD